MSRPAIFPSPAADRVVWQPDRQWPRVLAFALAVGVAVAGMLLVVGWPRLETIAVHYDLIRLRAEVTVLQRREKALTVRLEKERNPVSLARRATRLGLQPPRTTQIRTLGPGVFQ